MNSHRTNEDGAVLVLVALVMSALFTASALAIDIGRVTQTKRQEQSLVDIVAIDAARAIVDGVPTSVQYADVRAAAMESAARNGYLLDELDTLDVVLGKWMDATRTFVAYDPADPVDGLLIPDAVRVVAVDDVKFLFDAGSSTASRQAVALHRLPGAPSPPPTFPPPPTTPPCVVACATTTTTIVPVPSPGQAVAGITIGSFLVRGTPDVAMLNALLEAYTGVPVNALLDAYTGAPVASATLVGYQGLADSSFTLDDLRVALRMASIDQLLSSDLALTDVLRATAAVLDAQGTSSASAAAAMLDPFARSIDSSVGPIRLRNLVEVSSGAGSAAGVTALPALPFVMGSAMLANRANLLDVDLSALAPGFQRASLRLLVIEPPVTAIGPAEKDALGAWLTTAKTSQIRAQLDLTLNVPRIGRVTLPIYFEGADATGALSRIACPVAGANGTGIAVDTSALRASLGRATDLSDGMSSVVPAPLMSLVPGGAVTGISTVTIAGAYSDLDFAWDRTDPEAPPQTTPVGAGIPDASVGDSLFGAMTLSSAVGTVPAPVRDALAPALAQLDEVLGPLVSSLGIQIGGADVSGLMPTCTLPVLVP